MRNSRWDPNRYRRRVRFQDISASGEHHHITKSFTREDDTRYHPTINVLTGECFCDCPDFRFRRRREGGLCKHLNRVLISMQRRMRPKTHWQQPVAEIYPEAL